uniref:NADH dehydrogenase [ubiquinone] 1 beta subcomplex subunit 6 n=1 Tax=Anolis carolinensis TaxID=28377 RepID=A0A803SZG8_ANOCA
SSVYNPFEKTQQQHEKRRDLDQHDVRRRERYAQELRKGSTGENFLKPGGLWRTQVYKTYKAGAFVFTGILVPFWLTHYYIKYHLLYQPYGVVVSKPKIFPGDTILETNEVVPPLEIPDSHH